MELLRLHSGDSEVRGHGSAEQGGAWQGPTRRDEQDRHCEGTSQSEATAQGPGTPAQSQKDAPAAGGLGGELCCLPGRWFRDQAGLIPLRQ